MAATKTSTYGEHFRPEKLKEWPEPESVALMEEIIFGDLYDPEVYNPFNMTKKDPHYGKVTVPPFCDPLFRRQQEIDEEKRAIFQYKTGKQYTSKQFKELEKARVDAKLPQFTFTAHSVIPKERHNASARAVRRKPPSKCSPENPICAENIYLPDKETTTLSQTVFERQFHSSKLNQENKRDEKKGLVSEDVGRAGLSQFDNTHEPAGADFRI
ncbi:protein FAM228A isoform X2 [Rhinolophus ferrumequinum]|uniref:protein FAM228A isoform X2 n=1 Tax=Rhinolophus ferrumequinum TaxID=59479 RepID=UPI00140F7CD2|nr:protein FAM228A isoform X2 [Rhinolophus ferrumequinum]